MSLMYRLWTKIWTDRYFQMAAALSYYTVLSIAPLLILVVRLAGLFMDSEQVNQEVIRWLDRLMGSGPWQSAGDQMAEILRDAPETVQVNSYFGVTLLLVAATGVVAQLQNALNTVWQVEIKQNTNWVKDLFVKRLLSFAMILAIAFVLQVSMVTQTLLTLAGERLSGIFSVEASSLAVSTVSNLGFFFFIWLIFAAMFRFLPDVHLKWKHVLYGALVTTILFVIGQYVLSFYLAASTVGQSFGAAGKLIAVLIWVYYASLTVLLGAGFSYVWTTRDGQRVHPDATAKSVSSQNV